MEKTCQGCAHWHGRACVDQKGNVLRNCELFRRFTALRCGRYELDGKVMKKEGS